FFFQFGITMSVAVLLSLLEALTLAPMRCSQFLEVGHNTWIGNKMDHFSKWLAIRYQKVLAVCLNHRWKVVTVAIAFFIGSLQFAKILKKEFVPAQDQSMFMVRMQ